MKRSIAHSLSIASAVLLGACAVVPAEPYATQYPANPPGVGYGGYGGYGGYESIHGGYTPVYPTQAPYYGGYSPGYVYPGYPQPQVGVGVIVPAPVIVPRAPVIVRPAPIVITPGHPRHDYRDDDRQRGDRRPGDRRGSNDREHRPTGPVVPAQPPAVRPHANVPRQEAFVPRDERGERPRERDSSRSRGGEVDRP